MLEKISICLCHPKLMGRYIIEKTSKAVWMVVILLLINCLTIGLLASFNNDLDNKDQEMIVNTILKDGANNKLKYDTKLEGTKALYRLGSIGIAFFDEGIGDTEAPIRLNLSSEGFNIYLLNLKLKEGKYSTGLKGFDLTDGISGDDRLALDFFMDSNIKALIPVLATSNAISSIMDMLVTFLMMFLFLVLIGGAINPVIQGSFKVRLAFLSLFSYAFIYWFFLATDFRFFYYLAAFLPYIYYFIAARNIIKIKA